MSDISRRAFTALCFAASGSAGAGAQRPAADEKLQSELLMDLILHTQPAHNVGSVGVNAGAEKYLWLNNIVAVGVRRTLAGKVAYRIYQIL